MNLKAQLLKVVIMTNLILDLSNLDFDRICRACLSEGNLKSLFNTTPDPICGILFSDIFMACTSIVISEDDGLPTQICEACIFRISQIYWFKRNCQRVDDSLHYYVDKTDVERFLEVEIKEEPDGDGSELDNYSGDSDEKYIAPEQINNNYDEISRRLGKEEPTAVEPRSPETKFVDEPKPFVCGDCDKSFTTKLFLKVHTRTHTGERPFQCDLCDKSFKQKGALKIHRLIHTDEKVHLCNTCGKTFKRKAGLKIHRVVHSGLKPYTCKYCDKTFSQGGHLKYHMRIHSGEKPYACKECGKAFASKGTLTVHTRTHTGETPFVCPVCGKGYHDSSSMKKHQRGHKGKTNHKATFT